MVNCSRVSGGAEICSRLPIMRGTLLRGMVMRLDRVALVTQSGLLRLELKSGESFFYFSCIQRTKIPYPSSSKVHLMMLLVSYSREA